MTDFHSPPDHDDDDLLASLYLDGEASADQIALVESSPRLLSIVSEFRSIADTVGALPTPPTALRATQLQSALDHFEAATPADGAAPNREPTNVRSLTDRRRSRPATGHLPAWLGAAAATVFVIGGVGFALSRGSSSGSNGATDSAASEMTRSASALDSPSEDFAEDSAAGSESLMADTTSAAAEASDDITANEGDAAEPESAEATTTTGDNRVSEQVIDLGPLDGRTAIEIAETLIADATNEFRPIEEARCFASRAEEQLSAEAQPGSVQFVPVVWSDGSTEAGPHELVIYEKRGPASNSGSTGEIGAVVLDRGDCLPLVD